MNKYQREMRKRSFHANEKWDGRIDKGYDLYWGLLTLAFFALFCVFLCKEPISNTHIVLDMPDMPEFVHKIQTAAVGDRPYQERKKAPCVPSYIPFLTVGDCND